MLLPRLTDTTYLLLQKGVLLTELFDDAVQLLDV